jgi:ABC-type bacteriocin/lantibiotic exporter with double-glycine peptidase domain
MTLNEERKNMKVIVQEDPTGCGIACAAMLAGKSYQAAKKQARSLGIFIEDENLYSDTRHLRQLLESYNVRISKKKILFKNWALLPPLAILAIKYNGNQNPPTWHWVVYRIQDDKPVVLDSKRELKRNLRTDFGRMKPKWYIKVAPI